MIMLSNPPKAFFTQSIVQDGFICSNPTNLQDYLECVKTTHNNIKINQSKPLKGEFNFKNHTFYEMEVFELELGGYSWIILNYKDTNSNGWYRIKGFKENDFIHFYNRILKFYIKNKKDITNVIEGWQEENETLKKINFGCLENTIKKKNTICDCMIANSFLLSKNSVIVSGRSSYQEKYYSSQGYDKLHSHFSNRLYQGDYP